MVEPYIGVIIIGTVLLAIVLAFIFSSKFRKDVIASEGEAAVLGLINVKGVIIVLLTGIFGGMFIYLYPKKGVDVPVDPKDVTVQDAINILRKNNKKLELEYKQDSIFVSIGADEIGGAPFNAGSLTPLKDKVNKKWLVSNGSTGNLGHFYLSNTPAFLRLNATKRNTNLNMANAEMEDDVADEDKVLYLHSNYQLDGTSLLFSVDSVHTKPTTYWLTFGEGIINRPETHKFRQEPVSFKKTPDGILKQENQFQFLTDPSWEKFYFVGVGLGIPVKSDDGLYNHVDFANIVVLEGRFTKN